MFRALAEAGRVSNLPTVWTNALVGAALAGWAGEVTPLAIALSALSLLYLGGMFLNDALDASWDREHKRGRPIADGRLSRTLALWIAVAALLGGLGLAAMRAEPGRPDAVGYAGGLVCGIFLYNWLHKRYAWAVLLMAGCRALVYPLAASIIAPEPTHPVWPASLAIAGYTVLLTLAARREDDRGAKVSAAIAWLTPLPYAAAASAYHPARLVWTIFAAAALVGWLTKAARDARRGRVREAVLAWLAGICLGDTLLLALLDRLDLAGFAVAGWLVTVLAHRRISGT